MSGVALKRICELVTDSGPEEEERPFVALEHVVGGTGQLDKDIELPRRRPASGLAAIESGDVLFGKLRPYLAKTLLVSEQMFASTELMALRPAPNVDSRWLHYLLMGDQVMGWAVATSEGSKMPRTSWSDLGEFRVTVPDLPEQRAIADYLDAEIARIDALIEKKRRLIELLAERDRRMIDECFAPRDSETLIRLARFADVRTGITLHEGRELEADAVSRPYLRVANVQPGWLDLSEVKSVTVPKAMAVRSRLRAGDVLMTEGGDIDKLGRGTVWREEIPDCLHQNHVFAVRPDLQTLDSEYLGYLTRTSHARAYFEMTGSQSTNLASTSASKVSDFRIPALPINEQRKRVERYQKFAAKNQRMSNALTEQLELLTEHRQALITAAVTGRVEVPGDAVS